MKALPNLIMAAGSVLLAVLNTGSAHAAVAPRAVTRLSTTPATSTWIICLVAGGVLVWSWLRARRRLTTDSFPATA